MINDMLDRLREVGPTFVPILIDPTSNPRVALLLYASIAILLLLVLVIGIMIVMAGPEDEAAAEVSRHERKVSRVARRVAVAKRPVRWRVLGVGIPVVLLCVWVLAGFTTSTRGLCISCHGSGFEHAKADKSADPHAKVDCVACHEQGGVVGRYVTGVPLRLLHLAFRSGTSDSETQYGQTTAGACTSCHAAALLGTATNAERGLKMSHAAPMAASATCTDCHTMSNGIVGTYNAGMKQCLRCHDGDKVSAACTMCHNEKVTAAARARTTSFQRTQIREVSCGGCHNEKRDCDGCHGLRMPHSEKFMGGTHARAAAVDIWFSGGKVCGRCHTGTRHPCTRCHSALIGRAHGTTDWLAKTHQTASSASCNSCHAVMATSATRDFCKDVCHSPAAIAASPR